MNEDDIYFTIDFGVNYASKKYEEEEIKKLLEESYTSGVDAVVSISNSISESVRNIKLSKIFPRLYFTLGVHPHNAKNFKEKDLELIGNNLSNSKCFGIGEIGLDYNRLFSTKEEQINAFVKQLELAKTMNSNVYLHCREAFDDMIKIIKEVGHFKGVVHCFTGTLEQALEFTSLGFKIGITGWLLDQRRNSDLVRTVSSELITLDMLFVETDAPFMPIKPSKKSISSDTAYIVEEIARLKRMDQVDVGKHLYKNAVDMLKITN